MTVDNGQPVVLQGAGEFTGAWNLGIQPAMGMGRGCLSSVHPP